MKIAALILLAGAFECAFDWDTSLTSIANDIGNKTDRFDDTNNIVDLATYDFVFIGTGSGGSTCAAGILNTQPNAKILMLEAGSHNLSSSLFEFKNGPTWTDTMYDWNDTAAAELGLENRTLSVSSGFSLGGSSMVGFMYWIRGDPADFNSWAKLTSDDSWNYTNVLKYFKRIEKYSELSSAYRGDSGDVFISRSFSNNNFSERYKQVVQSTLNLTNNQDYNGESIFGASTDQLNCKPTDDGKGKRQDAFSTQLEKYLGKTNFHVLTTAVVDKLILTPNNKSVSYVVFQRNGRSYKVRALKDVVLSAGAIRSPLILQRSGIGQCASLEEKGVACRVSSPGVGKNLDYHLASAIFPAFNSTQIPTENVLFSVVTGKTNSTGTDLAKHLYLPFYLKDAPIVVPFALFTAYFQLHSRSKGEISLRSTNPADKAYIELNGFQNADDRSEHVEGLRNYLQIASSLQNASLLSSLSAFSTDVRLDSTDAELETFVRKFATVNNVAGTCKMGRVDDSMAVVDSRLRVKGVKGLRVVDASVMPHVTSGSTNSPTMMIGSKAADEILKDYPSSSTHVLKASISLIAFYLILLNSLF